MQNDECRMQNEEEWIDRPLRFVIREWPARIRFASSRAVRVAATAVRDDASDRGSELNKAVWLKLTVEAE